MTDWKQGPCFYVSVVDAGRVALVLGPFQHEADCRAWAYRDPAEGGDPSKCNRLRHEADRLDPRSCFYAWGMVKYANGQREGVMNTHVPGWEATPYWERSAALMAGVKAKEHGEPEQAAYDAWVASRPASTLVPADTLRGMFARGYREQGDVTA